MEKEIFLEDQILRFLEKGPQRTTAIIEELVPLCQVTRQGIYKALRKLRREETVTVHKKIVSLSLVWLDQELTRLLQVASLYQSPGRGNFFLALRPGEHITFRFRTLQELDLFWTQAFLQIIPSLQKKEPVYSVIPHDWFSYARPATDTAWVKAVERGLHPQRMVLTHPTLLDKKVFEYRHRLKRQPMETCFGKNPYRQDERDYYNLAGPWILQARLDEGIVHSLNSWIRRQKTLPLSLEVKKEMEAILSLPGKHRLKISHAPKQSAKLQKKVEKYFVFPVRRKK